MTDPSAPTFRPQAVAGREVAARVDDQLRLPRPRRWVGLAGAALLVGALVVWAAFTPSVAAVVGTGRAVGSSGVLMVSAPDPAVVSDVAQPGQEVTMSQPLATATTDGARREVRAPVPGTVWQQLAQEGAVVRRDDPIVALLPPDATRVLLVPVAEEQSTAIRVGQSVEMADGTLAGAVTAVSGPIPAATAADRTELPMTGPGSVVLVSVTPDRPMVGGQELPVKVVTTQTTVLARLLGR